jgi:hypothetical protein
MPRFRILFSELGGLGALAVKKSFLAFELKPKPALSRRLVSAKQREDGSTAKAETG